MALLVIAAIATRVVWFGDPVADFDEQLYSYIGAKLLNGQLPYVDVWDRKPFGLFAIFALGQAVGGSGPIGYQMLATLFAAAGSWLIHALARPRSDRATACGAALLYLPLVSLYGSYSGQSEVFLNPPVLAMLLLVSNLKGPQAERRAMLAMLCGGIALQIKYTAVIQCCFCAGVALWHFRSEPIGRQIGRAAVYALLGLLPTAMVAALYAVLGHFDAFWFANFQSIFHRIPAPGGRFDPRGLSAFAPLAMLAAAGAYASWRGRASARVRPGWLVIGWSLATLLGIFVPSTIYVYYFAAFVPAAVLLAAPLLDARGRSGLVPLTGALAGAALMVGYRDFQRDPQRDRAEVAAFAGEIASAMQHDDRCLLVYDGPTALYDLTRSCAGGHFVYPDHLNNALESEALGVSQTGEVARLLALEPGVIVTADRPVTYQNPRAGKLVETALQARYRRLATSVIDGRTYRAWALRR